MGQERARSVVLDAGALIAFERGDGRMRALARAALEKSDSLLIVPAGVLAQVWRDGSRQARLAVLVESGATQVTVLDAQTAKATGALCGRSGTADVVDASVVIAARVAGAPIVTADTSDLRRLDPDAELIVLA